MGSTFEAGAQFIRAVDADHSNNQEAEKLLESVASGKDVPRRRATALLSLARRALTLRNNDVDSARAFVERMPVEGAQHVRAIAKRLLIS